MSKNLQRHIQQCKSGNRAAFQPIYENYVGYVYTICVRYDIPEQDRKDLIQEIFAEVYVSLKNFVEEKGAFQYWLRGIAIHTIFAYWKKRKTKNFQFFALEEVKEEEVKTEIKFDDWEEEYVKQKVQQLPPGYRKVFNLFVIDGYSHKEIAELLQIQESTSRSQLARAIRQLKSMLQNYKSYEII